MKTAQLFAFLATFCLIALTVISSSMPGCTLLTPAGDWKFLLSDGLDQELNLSAREIFRLHAGAPALVKSDSSGQWDWIRLSDSVTLSLMNSAGYFWHDPNNPDPWVHLTVDNLVWKGRSTRIDFVGHKLPGISVRIDRINLGGPLECRDQPAEPGAGWSAVRGAACGNHHAIFPVAPALK